MYFFLFAIWADNAVLGSEGVEELAADVCLMQNLKGTNKLQFYKNSKERTCVLEFANLFQRGIELSFERIGMRHKRWLA